MATHYCPQGNQPRLILNPPTTDGLLAFTFLDATNLENIDDNHQHYLSMELPSETSGFIRSEMYLSASGEDRSQLRLFCVQT